MSSLNDMLRLMSSKKGRGVGHGYMQEYILTYPLVTTNNPGSSRLILKTGSTFIWWLQVDSEDRVHLYLVAAGSTSTW